MVDVVLTNLASLANQTSAITAINSNNEAITDGFEDCLSVNDTSSNTMNVDLNMNANHLYNLPYPASNTEPIRLEDLPSLLAGVSVLNPESSVMTGMASNQIPVASGTNSIVASIGLGSGDILVGQSSGSPLSKAISGDASMTAAGALTVSTLNGGDLSLPSGTDTVVTLAAAQTLTNKTLTTPKISSITNTGTITLPTSTDTLVGRATTDTLTNKTLTSPVITSPTISGSGTVTFGTVNTTTANVSGNLAVTGNVTVTGNISGNMIGTAPVSTTTNYTVQATDRDIIVNSAGTTTMTLPTASSNTGRRLNFKTVAAQAVNSASSNVVLVTTTSTTTGMLLNTAGKYIQLISDGTNWITMASN